MRQLGWYMGYSAVDAAVVWPVDPLDAELVCLKPSLRVVFWMSLVRPAPSLSPHHTNTHTRTPTGVPQAVAEGRVGDELGARSTHHCACSTHHCHHTHTRIHTPP